MIPEQLKQDIQSAKSSGSWLAMRKAASQIRKVVESCRSDADANVQNYAKVAFLSTFTIEPLTDYLLVEAASGGILLDLYIGGYGQVAQEMLNPASGLYNFRLELVFVFAERDSLSEQPVHAAEQLNNLVNSWIQKESGCLVLCTFINTPKWPYHILPDQIETQIQKANKLLIDTWQDHPQVQICDLDRLAAYVGYQKAFCPQMMSMARIPFSESFLAMTARKCNSHILASTNQTKKCLVLDCDNTLWGGIIGEDGMEGIHLGPDWPGREFLGFQKAILELYEQGIILAINSKNNEQDVMQVLNKHPHMILREKHFASIQVNWGSKPQNMQRIADEINIGIDTLVFADDNPAEREIVRQMLPEIEVLDLPQNPALYEQTLRQSSFFTKTTLTKEDRNRGQIYAAQRQRNELQKTTTSLEGYLQSLEMICSIRLAQREDVKRIAQLTQRTNQFNLTTRRYTEANIQQMLEDPDWNIYVLDLKDKFGDNGMVALALVEKTGEQWRIDTFLMSCRIIGRQTEDTLVDRICRDAKTENAKTITAEFIQSKKNALVRKFWTKMNFAELSSDDATVHYLYDLSYHCTKTFEYLTLE